MSYGILAYNETGQVQIDPDYRNIQLIGFNDVSIVAGRYGHTVSITYTATGQPRATTNSMPIIAMRADATYYNSFRGIGLRTFFNDTWYYTKFHCYPEDDFTLYYTAWDIGLVDAENYGMVVYDASGELIFDVAMDWMKIESVNTGSAAKGSGNNHTVIDAVNNYFYLTNTCFDYVKIGSVHTRRGFKRTGSTTIRVDSYTYTGAALPNDPNDFTNWEDTYTLIEIKDP